MKNFIAIFVLSVASSVAVAGIDNCQDMYVGQVIVERGIGLKVVTFKNGPNDGGTSNWVSFEEWTSDDKKSALALLTSAKLSQHRVNISTNGLNSCALTGVTHAVNVHLAKNQ